MSAFYNVNPRKALEVILWMTGKRNPIDFYHILKIIYFADKYHLNAYGRPVLGDTYDALNHGPVARTVYNLLKGDGLEFQALDEYSMGLNDDMPIEVRGRYWVHGRRDWNQSLLSESDVEALTQAFNNYSAKSFRELERITHEERGWLNATAEGRSVMRYEDLVEDSLDKPDRLADIQEASRHVVF